MVVNITTIHFHYQVVTILGSEVHFNSSDVHYSVFTVYDNSKSDVACNDVITCEISWMVSPPAPGILQ